MKKQIDVDSTFKKNRVKQNEKLLNPQHNEI